ncbi:MAG: hypothetical protein ACOCQQ_02480 [Candidatus Nanoarchaeia archaeon]
MSKTIDIHKTIAIFLIIIGALPFIGINFGLLLTLVHVLTIVSGVIILTTR